MLADFFGGLNARGDDFMAETNRDRWAPAKRVASGLLTVLCVLLLSCGGSDTDGSGAGQGGTSSPFDGGGAGYGGAGPFPDVAGGFGAGNTDFY